MSSRLQRLAAEFGGTAFLLAVVVGSGIMGERLSGGNAGIALLANSLATGAGLYCLLSALQSTGAHFNPAVTALAVAGREPDPGAALLLVTAQTAGAVGGVLVAHAMFGEALIQRSAADRSGLSLMFAEFVATAGLLAVLRLTPPPRLAAAVAAYITAAYWFTASTSFANPAVTIARALTDTFSGIAWRDVPGFVIAQLLAAALMAILTRTATRGAPAGN